MSKLMPIILLDKGTAHSPAPAPGEGVTLLSAMLDGMMAVVRHACPSFSGTLTAPSDPS